MLIQGAPLKKCYSRCTLWSWTPHKDIHPSNYSDKRSETEHTNILSEGTEKSASQTPKFKCDLCSFQRASDKGVKQRTGIKHKIPQPDGQSDYDVDEREYALTVCPDDSESEVFMEKKNK